VNSKKGQGAIEYLLLIAAAVLIAAVVIFLLATMSGTGKEAGEEGMREVSGGLDNLFNLIDEDEGRFFIDGTNIVPIEGSESYSDYYQYDLTEASSLNLAQESNHALFYLYQQQGSSRIGIAIVLDKQDDGSSGDMQLRITGDAGKGNIVVMDDSGEMSENSSELNGSWSWAGCCTDGGLFTMPNNESWSLDFEIDAASLSGIYERYVVFEGSGRQAVGNSFTLSYEYTP